MLEAAKEVARQLREECAFPEMLTDAEITEAINTNGADCTVGEVRWFF